MERLVSAFWWASLITKALYAIYVYRLELEPSSTIGWDVWLLAAFGAITAVAGARLGGGLVQKESRLHQSLVRFFGGHELAALGLHAFLSLALIECAAICGVLVYTLSGSFLLWTALLGVSLLAWAVARPKFS